MTPPSSVSTSTPSAAQLLSIAQALSPFAKVGVHLLGSGLPDDAPVLELKDANNQLLVLTRGHFVAACVVALMLDGVMDEPSAPPVALTCLKCGADRFKDECAGPANDCGMRFDPSKLLTNPSQVRQKTPRRVQELRRRVRAINRVMKGRGADA